MAIANVGDFVRINNRLCKVVDRTESVFYFEELFTRDRFQVNVIGNYPSPLTSTGALMAMWRELDFIKKKSAISPAAFQNIEWLLGFVEDHLKKDGS